MSNASGDDEELKELLDAWEAAVIEGCESSDGDTRHDWDAIAPARKAVESLFGRIREAALTPEEAEMLLWELDRDEEHPYFTFSGYVAVTAKLRRISGGALKEGATQ